MFDETYELSYNDDSHRCFFCDEHRPSLDPVLSWSNFLSEYYHEDCMELMARLGDPDAKRVLAETNV